MDLKKGILYSIILWVLIFFEVSVLLFGFNLPAPSWVYRIIHFTLLALFVMILSNLYFLKADVERNLREGFYLGVLFIVSGLLLDACITIPLFVKDYTFLFQPDIIIGYCGGLFLATVSGLKK